MFNYQSICLPTGESGNRMKFDSSVRPKTVSNIRKKGFVTDLAFLSREAMQYNIEDFQVIYVSSINSRHHAMLAAMFPHTDFFLYHPSPYKIETIPNIKYMGKHFSDDEAHYISGLSSSLNLIFICETTMTEQLRWIQILKPTYWSVRFMIPEENLNSGRPFDYLSGRLTYVPFAKSLSPELRLQGRRSDIDKMTPYNPVATEEMTFHHNVVVRPKNFDISFFVFALKMYTTTIEALSRPSNEDDILRYADSISDCMK